ncbi:MAG: C45 family peptidase [Candidatus Micrarchaeia archaeon]
MMQRKALEKQEREKRQENQRGAEREERGRVLRIPMTEGTMRMTDEPLQLVRARGAHYDIGKAVGEQCRREIENQIAFYFTMLRNEFGMSKGRAVNRARKYLQGCEMAVPELLDELKGMADGSGRTFDEIFAVNCIEEIIFESDCRKPNSCTGFAVAPCCTSDGHTYLAHNEDWLSRDKDNQYILYASPTGDPEFIALTYGAVLPATGVNSAGIAQSSNAQGHIDFNGEGVPCMFVARKVLSARMINEAAEYATMENRATGTNHLIASSDGLIFNIETSATEHYIIKSRRYAVHSNHYLSPRMDKYTSDEDKDSLGRYSIAERLVSRRAKSSRLDLDGIRSILSNHGHGSAANPELYALCQHWTKATSIYDENETISSVIIDLTTRIVWACRGNPCRSNFVEYRFDRNLEGASYK